MLNKNIIANNVHQSYVEETYILIYHCKQDHRKSVTLATISEVFLGASFSANCFHMFQVSEKHYYSL